jgi:hypothetical protein
MSGSIGPTASADESFPSLYYHSFLHWHLSRAFNRAVFHTNFRLSSHPKNDGFSLIEEML